MSTAMLKNIPLSLKAHFSDTEINPHMSALNKNSAGVLLLVTKDSLSPSLVLTQRSLHLNSHAGEIAFPGGKVDDTDADLIETALRETEEEIGLPAEQIEVIGQLAQRRSKLGIRVHPYIGLIEPGFNYLPNHNEIDAVFELPIDILIDEKNWGVHPVTFNQKTINFPAYYYQHYNVWGLTALFIIDMLDSVFNTRIQHLPEYQDVLNFLRNRDY